MYLKQILVENVYLTEALSDIFIVIVNARIQANVMSSQIITYSNHAHRSEST